MHIVLQIFTSEPKRVSCVDNLDHKMRAFDDTPELTPNFQIAFEGGEEESIFFLQNGKPTSPFEESVLLLPVELGGGHTLLPWRTAGHTEALFVLEMLLDGFLLFLVGEQIWVFGLATGSLLNDLDVSPL